MSSKKLLKPCKLQKEDTVKHIKSCMKETVHQAEAMAADGDQQGTDISNLILCG